MKFSEIGAFSQIDAAKKAAELGCHLVGAIEMLRGAQYKAQKEEALSICRERPDEDSAIAELRAVILWLVKGRT